MSTFEIAINTTVSGVGIVFGMLLVLVVVIWLLGMLMSSVANGKKQNKNKQKEVAAQAPKAVPTQTAKEVLPASADADDEIIAVIAAAVDAIYSQSEKRAVIRSIKPSSGFVQSRNSWAMAGIRDNVRAF